MKSSVRLLIEGFVLLTVVAVLIQLRREQQAPDSQPEVPSVVEHAPPPARIVGGSEFSTFQPDRSSPGLTLYPEAGSGVVRLINLKGETVKTWNVDAMRARLLPNCNLLVIHGTKWGMNREPWRSLRSTAREYSWDGEVVWEYTAPGILHHDVSRLENGNTLLVYKTTVPKEYMKSVRDPAKQDATIRTDIILEVTADGDIVWQWKAHEHFDLNSCGDRPCPEIKPGSSRQKNFDWTHINTIREVPPNKWFDAGDTRFTPGNIFILPRNWWMAMIVDRASGKVVWRYTGDYKGGLSGGHEVHMIERGLPGAGNVLIFDNGRDKKKSFGLEIDPTTKQPVWIYDSGKSFFSSAAGSLQRLPNGNTLLSEDTEGRVFEVSPDGDVVWQYQGEFRSARAHRYAYDFCPRLSDYK